MPIIQSVDRALRIIDLFDEINTELKITEISKQLNLNKSTTHSLLKTLKQHNYIKQDSESGKYSLGLKLLERGNFVLNSLDIRTVTKKYITQLSKETGQTVHLVVLEGKTGVYIDKVEGASAIVYSRIGRRVPIHSSAVGKALMAHKSNQEIDRYLDDYDFFEQTKNTVTSKQAYLKELNKVILHGYAFDNEENEVGVCCIAVPLFNHSGKAIAAISISSTTANMTRANKDYFVEKLKETASSISNQMGYTAPLTTN